MLNDADCGFCMRTGRLVPRLGVDVDSSTVQAADLEALGVDPVRAVVEMPYVHPDGRVDYGHRAFASILRTGPLPWRVVGTADRVPSGRPDRSPCVRLGGRQPAPPARRDGRLRTTALMF